MAVTQEPTPTPEPKPIPTAKPAENSHTHLGSEMGGDQEFSVSGPMFSPPAKAGEVGTLGHYRILKQLGRGGMGAVYLAFDPSLERKVAIKVMAPKYANDPTSRNRFLREARACAKIKSDHVVTIHQVGEIAGTPFISMEYLEGYSLDRYLADKGSISLSQAVRIGRETALGLQAAHEQGLVHRDIKPSNLWLEAPKGRVKLIDFGLARPEEADVELTGSGAVVGTPAYMSPEQGRAETVDHRSDLFSLGGVLYRLLTGEMPFKGNTTMALLRSLELIEPTPIRSLNPQVPEAVAALVHQLLEKDPTKRPQTATEVAERLHRLTQTPSHLAPVIIKVEPLPISIQTENVWEDIEESAEPTVSASTPEAASNPKPKTPKKASKLPWILAGLGLLAAIVVAVIVLIPTAKGTLVIESDDPEVEVIVKKDGALIRDKTKDREIALKVGDYTIELAEKKDGWKLSTEKFHISKNGKETVRVRLEKPLVPGKPKEKTPTEDPERVAAKWILNHNRQSTLIVEIIGGNHVSGIKTPEELPSQPFFIRGVHFVQVNIDQLNLANVPPLNSLREVQMMACHGNEASLGKLMDLFPSELTLFAYVHPEAPCVTKITWAKLARFSQLNHLHLANPGVVPDEDVSSLAKLTKLELLNLQGMNITDAGFARLKGMPIKSWTLPAKAGDESVRWLADQPGVTSLGLVGSQVTPQCLADIGRMTQLIDLSLGKLPLTEPDVAHLARLRTLETLKFSGTKLPAGAYDVFLQMPKLVSLEVQRCDEADVQKLAKSTTLLNLDISATKITPLVLESLGTMRNLRSLRIHGAPDPVPEESIRKLHEQIPDTRLTFGTMVFPPVSGDRRIAERVLNLGGAIKVIGNPTTITHMNNLPKTDFRLAQIAFGGNQQVTDESLAICKSCTQLKMLFLDRTNVTDAALLHFVDCKELTQLNLWNTKITDKNLATFKNCPDLRYVSLSNTAITNLALTYFSQCDTLQVSSTAITDDGLAHLVQYRNLRSLKVNGTAITDKGLKHLTTLTRLQDVDLRKTQVTGIGVAELRKALPSCRIEWDGTLDPK